MKKSFLLALVFIISVSCEKNEDEKDVYYIQFQLKEAGGDANLVNLIQDTPKNIGGNGIKDSDFVAVGFGISGSFLNPSDKEISQMISFHLSTTIPEEEFVFNSGVYEFKNPSNLKNYIPSGNLFEDEVLNVITFFHEDEMSFCTAGLDQMYDNDFKITRNDYYVDTNGDDAMDIEGTFSMRYNSVCNTWDTEISDGRFRIKLLIDEIP